MAQEETALGLGQVLCQFSHTFPGSSNIEEWKAIRDGISANADQPSLIQFRRFVEQLNRTRPTRDNIKEWERIRNTCNDILVNWGPDSWGQDKERNFKDLLQRFLQTSPTRDNIQEWEKIRDICNQILLHL